MLGQNVLLAFDDAVTGLTVLDGTFAGVGRVVAPFDMVEITGEPKFYDFEVDEHVFVSRMPCYNNQYYLFMLKASNVIDISQTPNPFWLQNEPIMEAADGFQFYYTSTPYPLKLANVDITRHEMPATYPSREARTGKIDGVELTTVRDQNELISTDSLIKPLTTQQIDEIITTAQLFFNGLSGVA